MNNQNDNYLISSERAEINALVFSTFAYKMESLINGEKISGSERELCDKIDSTFDKLFLSLAEIRDLVKIYSQENFNKTNPFVRKVVYFARTNDPKDICSSLVLK